ncbi:MAG: Na/Pi cotransporter family protein, partial [Saprospiraceae bacterium]|nr:Na/Pi cotransporter family protein [Saprospiraceae bacterium]
MKFGIYEIFTLLGSLGIFLFGMKMMSEALLVIAGDKMRKILSAMTSNRFLAVLTGFTVTTVVQSSSATTVLIVSFVNAGLMSLVESVSVIMGANIGTTITAWLISILGFKISISALSLPLIAVGFPFLFSKNHKRKGNGEFLIGFAILFIGLAYLKDSVPDVKSHPEILEFLSSYTTLGYPSVFLFLLVGTILTFVVQSSSAAMALTLVMCYEGWIPFELAAAMVLGENIGTTITANLAASVANRTAKRAALAHLMFNIFGVIWILALFYPFVRLVNHLVISAGESSPYVDPTSIPIALSVFHSVFNITNTLIMIWFVALIVRAVNRILPSTKEEEEEEEVFKLKHISTRLLSISDLSILPAKNEIVDFAKHLLKMFSSVRKAMITTEIAQFEKQLAKIKK